MRLGEGLYRFGASFDGDRRIALSRTISSRLASVPGEHAYTLLRNLLQVDPVKRCTAFQALRSAFFRTLDRPRTTGVPHNEVCPERLSTVSECVFAESVSLGSRCRGRSASEVVGTSGADGRRFGQRRVLSQEKQFIRFFSVPVRKEGLHHLGRRSAPAVHLPAQSRAELSPPHSPRIRRLVQSVGLTRHCCLREGRRRRVRQAGLGGDDGTSAMARSRGTGRACKTSVPAPPPSRSLRRRPRQEVRETGRHNGSGRRARRGKPPRDLLQDSAANEPPEIPSSS